MRATAAWEQLLQVIAQHGKNLQNLLAVHTSTCSQPGKVEALVPSLEAAGFRQAHVTGSGAWTVSLDLPALYAPGDAAAFHLTVEGVSKKAVVTRPGAGLISSYNDAKWFTSSITSQPTGIISCL